MTHYYADSSVLVKRHIRETGTDWGSSGIAVITVNLRLFLLWSPGRLSIRTQRPNQHVCFPTAIPKDPRLATGAYQSSGRSDRIYFANKCR